MKIKDVLLLIVLGSIVAVIGARIIDSPGYMDAAYYYGGGMQLFEGKGFSDPYIWNYLDEPLGLPHPSHGYWMPIASILSAIGMYVLKNDNFLAGRVVFIVLTIIFPVFVYWFGYQIIHERKLSLLSGIMAGFSGFYLPFLTIPETFIVYMILGSLVLHFLYLYEKTTIRGQDNHMRWRYAFILGVFVGLMHLARADGIVWLIIILGLFIYVGLSNKDSKKMVGSVVDWLFVMFGYLIIFGPWLSRNIKVFNTFFAPGGSKALLLTSYNDMFLYPADIITFNRWWGMGVYGILRDRLLALASNIETAVAVQGLIFLFPLILLGLWKLREDIRVKAGLGAWGVTFIVMTVLFPYSGARGGFFHSGAALQPLFWSLAGVGLKNFIQWGKKVRGWNTKQASIVFSLGIIFLLITVSGMVLKMKVFNGDLSIRNTWSDVYENYAQIEKMLESSSYDNEGIIITVDPPGYYVVSKRPSIVIPYGDIRVVLDVAEKFNAQYLLLQEEHITLLDEIYNDPEKFGELKFIGEIDGSKLFLIEEGCN